MRGYAFVAIGANLLSDHGDPPATIRFAIARLQALSDAPLRVSCVYRTTPVDSPPGTPDFYNAVAGLVPGDGETPRSLLRALQAIENEAGRTRSGVRNEARTLDLDLVSFRDVTMKEEDLILPHPRAHERRFVLEPLREIAGGDFHLPGMVMSLDELIANVPGNQENRIL